MNNGNPRIIHLSEQAHKQAEAFHNALEKRLVDDLEPIEGWAGKLHGKIMRLAGILHLCKYFDRADEIPVEESTMAAAEAIGTYFLQHAIVAFNMAGVTEDKAEKDGKYILEKLLEKLDAGETSISRRDLLRACPRLKTNEERRAGLEVLINRGYIRIEESTGQNRHTYTVYLNPRCKGQ